MLVVVDDENKLSVFDIRSEECINEFESPESFNVTAIVHPLTYINQVFNF